jgi:hypothetical protein
MPEERREGSVGFDSNVVGLADREDRVERGKDVRVVFDFCSKSEEGGETFSHRLKAAREEGRGRERNDGRLTTGLILQCLRSSSRSCGR